MLKKTIYILFITFIYCMLSNSPIKAKEYCNIYEDTTLKETVELPFYFYSNTKKIEVINSWPQITYETSYIIIDSLTKCDLINEKVSFNAINNSTRIITVYDYSNILYTSINEDTFLNSKTTTNGTIIKGYSSLIDKEPPIFNGYESSYTTNINNPISFKKILSLISAYDKRDGNLTSKIAVEYNDYDETSKKLGTYTIILSVEDFSSNKASITFYIKTIDTDAPIIEGKQIYTSYLSSKLTLEEIKSNLTVSDNVDENLSSSLYICEDNYSKNSNKVGLYNLYFCVIDKSENSSSPFKIVIEVKDDISPTIEGLDYFTSLLSKPLTIQEIMYSLAAIDNGIDISDSIFLVKDYYTNYQNTTGEKSLVFQVMDSSNNLSKPFKVTINLIDDIPPQIFGLNIYTSYLSSPLSLTYLKQQLTVLDNLDGNISSSIEILDDSYSSNINKTGTYYITLQAKDNSNNTSEAFKINITNIDDVSPTIIGPNTLKYEINNKPNIENILNEFSSKDNADEFIEIIIENDTYSNSTTTGTYYIDLSCKDSSNNLSAPFKVKIEIVEILLNLNDLSLSLPTSKLFTLDEINKIINLNKNYTISQNTYTSNYSIPGSYEIEYKLENEEIITLKINTYNIEETKIINKEIKKETLLTKIKSFFKKIIHKIKNWFKNILFYIFI